MTAIRKVALTVVPLITLLCIFGSLLPGVDYSRQDRMQISAATFGRTLVGYGRGGT